MSDKRQKRKQSKITRQRRALDENKLQAYAAKEETYDMEALKDWARENGLLEDGSTELEKEVGEKCDEPMAMTPYGGATSFTDYESYLAAQEDAGEAYDLVNVFNSIIQNIISSEMPNKSAVMAQAAKDFQSRIQGLDMKEAKPDELQPAPKVEETPAEVDKAVGITQRLTQWFDGLKGAITTALAEPEQEPVYDFTSSLSSLKSADGKTMLMLHTTNAFRDRDREIFADKALQEYADKAQSGSPVDYWHTDWEIGRVVWTGYSEKALFELVEPYSDIAVKELVDNVVSNPGYWGTSHRFHFDAKDKQNGVFNRLIKSKSSVLPIHAAANPFTAVAAVGRKENTMDNKKIDELKSKLSPQAFEQAKAFILGEEQKSASLTQAGVEHKEVAAPDPVAAVATATPQVATPAATPPPDIAAFTQALQATLAPVVQRLEQLEQKEKAREDLPRAAALFQSPPASRSEATLIPAGTLADVGPGQKSIEPEDMMILSLRQALGGAVATQ